MLLFCVLVCLAGAAAICFLYMPLRYSDEEVDAYVRTFYGDSWTLQKKKESSDRRDGITGYLYAGRGGEGGREDITFSVFTASSPVFEDGLPTGRSRKVLYDNYFSKVIDSHREDLEELSEEIHSEGGPELEIEETGQAAGAYGAQYIFRLYLEKHRQIDEAASLLAQMDEILSFACGRGEGEWAQARPVTPRVEVYMKPVRGVTGGADAVTSAARSGSAAKRDAEESIRQAAGSDAQGGALQAFTVDLPVDWRDEEVRSQYLISEISLTSFTDREAGSSVRLRQEDVAVRLENDYVDAARTYGRTYYSISEDLAARYPAPILTLVNIGGHAMTGPGTDDLPAGGNSPAPVSRDYHFVYHRRTGTYWLVGLDPCEDFDGTPFGDYPRRGAFADLVKCLGGTFTPGEWSGTWRIGQTHWKASLQTQKTSRSPYTYQTMRLTRDGNIIPLDPVPEVFAGTGALPSGRPFSIQDLIRMLNVRITINQKDMTAVMFRDFENE